MAVFDKEAFSYDDWYNSKLGEFVDKVETDLVFSLYKPTPGMKVLDVGCGTGNFSIKLAEMGCDVTGIDISEEMLNLAREKAKDKDLKIEFKKIDVLELDFPPESFDLAITVTAFEFIKETEKAYKKMYETVKPSGHMLIGTINRESNWGDFYLSDTIRENTVFKYAHFKSMEYLKSLNSKEIIKTGEGLFISPDTEEDDINLEMENQLKGKERGGFVCVLWKKGN